MIGLAVGALGDEGDVGGSYSRWGCIAGGSTGLEGNTIAGAAGGTSVGMGEILVV